MAPPPTGGRASQRGRLLDAAMELFARGGSRGTPLSAIAERIGVTAPAITHHFGTKQGLLLAIVDELDRDDAELVAVRPGSGSGAEQLDAMRRHLRRLEGDVALVNLTRLRMVIVAEALDPDFVAHEHFLGRHRAYRKTVAGILQEGQRDGTIRGDVDVERTAAEIMALFQGAQFQWLLDSDGVDLGGLIDGYFERLLRELAPAAPNRRGAGSR